VGGERIVDADSSDDDEVIDVKEWVPDEQLEPLTTLTFICRRKSGKTNAIKDICERYFRHHIRHFVLFSPTADADSASYPFIDRRFVFPRPSATILRRIEARQKRLLVKNKMKEGGQAGMEKSSKRICLIFDDHFDMMDADTQKQLSRIMSIGRHLHMTVIQAVQYSKGTLTPAMRMNSDWIFLSANLSHETMQMLAKEHLPGGEASKQILKTVPQGFRFLVIGNAVKTSSSNLSEVIFHYEARAPDQQPDFQVNGLLEDSSSDEDDENVQVGRVNKGEHMGPKYGAVDPEYSRDRTTNLDQGKEWHGRMEDQYTDEQVNLVEGTAGQEMADEW